MTRVEMTAEPAHLRKRDRLRRLFRRPRLRGRVAMMAGVPALALASVLPAEPVAAGKVELVQEVPPPPAPIVEIEPEVVEPPRTLLGETEASYYGARFAGRLTASGETFDPEQPTAAHRTLPFGTMVEVTNLANGKTVIVKINDRGPFHDDRDIDLSRSAFEQIADKSRGTARVTISAIG
ncbi:septal ring lytic transglycosylase RlpA family protein [Sphingomicrobium sediminis]|uniref:Endolytic peptidoglycan transglycosylase RlpA n=1 Tax=Sphingomicrobium sediminis TaxID=2950949 RepID=A0A9X2EHQ8_9SPHN|nr:septal ring lytic transglycosylase RlpA family protein [Sphingomicrobium sediminis]MCM8557721.1 septal ring lytic transglycosylase RlpA family protein [Sphingomicrobium sediminis]